MTTWPFTFVMSLEHLTEAEIAVWQSAKARPADN